MYPKCIPNVSQNASQISRSCIRSCWPSFFTLQALQYVRTGEYPYTKSELAKQLEGDEARILEVNRDWDTYRPSNEAVMRELIDLILGWAEGIICSSCK
jgi:hypothetical protein